MLKGAYKGAAQEAGVCACVFGCVCVCVLCCMLYAVKTALFLCGAAACLQGVAGWVHEGLLAAAAYVVSNTVDALAEAAQRCPGWPLVVAGG